jgi:hypothetical protein
MKAVDCLQFWDNGHFLLIIPPQIDRSTAPTANLTQNNTLAGIKVYYFCYFIFFYLN